MTTTNRRVAPNCDETKCRGRVGGRTYKIVMVRHGQSEWNEQNIFTGWYDSNLTERGRDEALRSGKLLKEANFICDLAISSVLTRAIETMDIILEELEQKPEIRRTWRLNERHYGALTGLNKAETAEQYGEEQVKIWRRSFDVPPPAMEEDHQYYDEIVNDPRYEDGPPKEEFPMFESLKLTIDRTLPYWNDNIIPEINNGKRILICAHGNSLRGIVKHLDNLSEEQILELNLPTGIPFYYKLDKNIRPVENGSLNYLGDPEDVEKALAEVKAQGKKKEEGDEN